VPAPQNWQAVLDAWAPDSHHARLRAYSDAVTGRLLEQWLDGKPAGAVLKTDAFDESVGVGLVPLLRARASTLVVIDVADAVVAAAAERYPDVRFELGDVRALDFPDGAFDVVVSNSTLDHFGDLEELSAALGELARVLAPGGSLVLTLDNPLNPLVALRNRIPGLLARLGVIPYRMGATCGPRRLDALLREHGLAVVARGATMHFPRVLAAVWLRLRKDGARGLLRFERLDALPTRYLTGQFVAAKAQKRP
jgi:SAM-dependent methyltransferase